MKDHPSASDELLALERILKSRFHPIKPDQRFVGNLRSRLENSPRYSKQHKTAYIFITTAGGLLFGLIIFLIGKELIQGSREA
ncbi:MAG TPA: hypothetical protein PKZ33_06685 [Brevefilum sp.]|mgnify:CR=1 FL=1|nr:hypothetical protein [Brevefilum sp.]